MLADPQTVTIAGTPRTLPRVNQGNNKGEFLSSDGNTRLSISHQFGRRSRRVVRIDLRKVAVDPISSVNQEVSSSVYVVIDHSKFGFTTTELVDAVAGLSAYLTANTNAVTTKVIGGES